MKKAKTVSLEGRGLALRLAAAAALLLAAAAPPMPRQASGGREAPVPIKLYTLDCGLTEFKDGDVFSDTGEYAGKSMALPTPCFLIQHGRDWMLWDTGVGDALADKPIEKFGGRFSIRHTLASQLAQLGVKREDVHYVGLSHLHFDHSGNIGLFPKSTFLIPAAELAAARGKPTPPGVDPEQIAPLEQASIISTDGDYDVFGDGSVVTLTTPGHTAGHHSLLVKLPKSGPVLISGDLFHTRQNLEKGLVPRINERTNTLASMDRFNRLATNMKARMVVQHAPEDFAAMPAFPKFLD